MPPFDPLAYARESESKMRSATPVTSYVADEDSGIQPIQTRALELDLDEPDSDPLRATRPVPIMLMAVPTIVVSRADLGRLTLDHRAGFILSHVDGVSDVETILDVSAMPSEEALRILAELAAQGIITLR
jgi:hypothetical protein